MRKAKSTAAAAPKGVKVKPGLIEAIKKDYKKNKYVLFMAIPVFIWYLVFCYLPMFGISIAFMNFNIAKGFTGSVWVGLKYFKEFFGSYYAWRIIKNTLLISFYNLVFGFTAPILLAILLNEIRMKWFKKTVQTMTYLPHFISLVVVCGMITTFVAKDGLINDIVALFGGERVNYLLYPQYFRSIYIITEVWQQMGWGSIIYMSAFAAIDVGLYEAASIDGASRWKQFWHITIPGIMPTIVVMLILTIGKVMSVGADKVILLYNDGIYETADIISSFVYRRGLLQADYSFSAAVGLFNGVINLILVGCTNFISNKFADTSLW